MVAKYPAIPEPTLAPESLRDSLISLKQAFEILTGQRGNPDYAALLAGTGISDAIEANTTAVETNTAAIAKLTNNQLARVSLAASQTVPTASVWTVVNFDTVDFDPNGIWDATNKRFKPTVPGYYRASCGTYMTWASGNSQALVSMWKSGGETSRGTDANWTANWALSRATDLIYFNGTTDYIDFRVYISSAATPRTVVASNALTHAEIHLVKAD